MHMLKPEVVDKATALMKSMPGSRLVEIGTGWGESASFFSKLKPDWTIYTIDAFGLYGDGRIYSRWDHDQVSKVIEGLPANVIQIVADSAKVPWELPIDVLFIDGGHSFNECLSDFLNYAQWVVPNGLIIFDDYNQENNSNNGVKQVVQHIVNKNSQGYKLIHAGYYAAILKKL